MVEYKIIEQKLFKNSRTGEFIHRLIVNPVDGGPLETLELGFDGKEPFNGLVSKNGYRKVEDEDS